jgi:hypothetical protein
MANTDPRLVTAAVQPSVSLMTPVPPPPSLTSGRSASQLSLPIQAVPVSRWETLPAMVIPVHGVTSFIPQVSLIRDSHSYFSSEVDQRLGICPVLSAYAVARCFQAGGLF